MRPTTDEFTHSRAGWRSEVAGFSIEVRWGGFSAEEPEGVWWWSVCVSEDQLSVARFLKIRVLANSFLKDRRLHTVDVISQYRTSYDDSFTDVRYSKMSRRAEGQSAALAETEARNFCLLLFKEFPDRKVWDQASRSFIKEQEKTNGKADR